MLSAIHKSRQLYMITLDRIGDYMDLLRVEVKLREQQIAMRVVGFAIAMLFGLLTTVFFGVAIIVSFWGTEFQAWAAWAVVVLYGAIAGITLYMAVKHFQSHGITATLRNELQRDINVIKENI